MKLESPKRCNISTSFLSSYLLTLWMLLVAQTAYAQDPPPNLFSATNLATEAPQISNPTVRRSRLASINFSLLGAEPNIQQGLFQPVINLNLFADTTLPAIHDRTEKTPRGFAWIGHIQDKPLSQVTIVVNGDVVSGNISSPEGRYHIRFAGKGIHAIQEIDSSKFPEEDPPFQPLPTFAPKAHKAASKEAVSAKEDDGSEIDVMVAYTDDARNTVGGTAAMESLIDLGILETNTAYANSDVNQRLNLVHTVEVAYNETGNMETDLDCITDTSDGCLDNLHTLRDQYNADLVSLWTNDGGNYCGLAWLLSDYYKDQFGFSVVDEECATGNYSFGHELGHNMGLDHDTYVANNTMFPYGHGFAYPAGKWRTIMAYSNACSAQGVSCPKIQYFSTPLKARNGVAIGDASTADNHRVLNETANTVANFRQSNAVDTTPNSFTFTDQTNVALSTEIVSNVITISGINAAADINIIDGEYSINGGAYTNADGTVSNGNTVTVKHTSSDQNGADTDTTLTIGGISDTFTSTTKNDGVLYSLSVGMTGDGAIYSDPDGIDCTQEAGEKSGNCSAEFAEGETVELFAEAWPGYVFDRWQSGCSGTEPSCTLLIEADQEVAAIFVKGKTLTVETTGDGTGNINSTPEGIDCGSNSDCEATFISKTNVTLTATAEEGSKFAGWTGCTSKTNICKLNMATDKAVSAKFITIHTLDVDMEGTGSGMVTSKPAGINCGSDCTEGYLSNTKVTLSAKATNGSKFIEWSGACTGASTCTVTMNEATQVIAKFDKITHKLTVSKIGNGTISSNPSGISCGDDCDEAVSPNTNITLTATPDAGYAFAGWTGCSSKSTVCSLKMSAAKTVTAKFVPIFKLSVNKTGTGSGTVSSNPKGITCGIDCEEDYSGNTTVKITAKADKNSRFTGWSGDCTGTSTCSVAMSKAKNVTANFDLK